MKPKNGDGGRIMNAPAKDSAWAALTWDDLGQWAGSSSVARGRAYQRGGRTQNLAISPSGELLATVAGIRRYTTSVSVSASEEQVVLTSACTCPVGSNGCKHAVAVVAEYLDALAEGREVPLKVEYEKELGN